MIFFTILNIMPAFCVISSCRKSCYLYKTSAFLAEISIKSRRERAMNFSFFQFHCEGFFLLKLFVGLFQFPGPLASLCFMEFYRELSIDVMKLLLYLIYIYVYKFVINFHIYINFTCYLFSCKYL